MSGADVKRQVTRVVVYYRNDNGLQRYVEYPPTCIVLTAEKAEKVRREILHLHAMTGYTGVPIDTLALLTPNQEVKV